MTEGVQKNRACMKLVDSRPDHYRLGSGKFPEVGEVGAPAPRNLRDGSMKR